MSGKTLRLIGGFMIVLAAFLPANAMADAVATTGNATSVTDTSARLNGVISPTYSDSAWTFEYSTASDFSANPQFTKPQAASGGTEAVSATVTGLKPKTTYYYRVWVYWQAGTGAASSKKGSTVSFTTLAPPSAPPTWGHVTLASPTIKVARRAALVKVRCALTSRRSFCATEVSLTISRGHGRAPLSCGTAKYGGYAPWAPTLRVVLSRGCVRALARAKHHRLHATLHAIFLGPQHPLSRRVTLAG